MLKAEGNSLTAEVQKKIACGQRMSPAGRFQPMSGLGKRAPIALHM